MREFEQKCTSKDTSRLCIYDIMDGDMCVSTVDAGGYYIEVNLNKEQMKELAQWMIDYLEEYGDESDDD